MKVTHLLAIFVAIVAQQVCTSCATSKSHQSTSTRVESDTLLQDRAGARTFRVSDSTHVADSVIILIQGDTIRLREVHWRTRYVSTSDTVRDTIRVVSSRSADASATITTTKTRGQIRPIVLLLFAAAWLGAVLLVAMWSKKP